MEKINIYVPEKIAQLLKNDAQQFEIFKNDRQTVNMNQFLSLLIVGYYDLYTKEYNDKCNQIVSILQDNEVSSANHLNNYASEIVKSVIFPVSSKKKGVHSKHLSLKPTKMTKKILLRKEDEFLNISSDIDSMSQYLCRMFIAYAQNPVSVREQIIFKETYDFLTNACTKKQSISFQTTWNESTDHEVLPYSVSIGKEELCNYLICQEYHKSTGKYTAATYRLCRIKNPCTVIHASILSEDVK